MSGLFETLPAEAEEDARDQLISMFAEPLDCLRELLQNALDAGSTEVEVTCTFEDDTAVLRVADFGEGMDRRTIETLLTRLFSSEKMHDRTKIGKFGIGYISVFALAPDAVCVDTGRFGESWRVVFRPDRTYTLVFLNDAITSPTYGPVEGTTVRMFFHMPRAEFENFEERVRKVLLSHGQYIELLLSYQGEPVSKKLDLEVPIKVTSRVHGETLIVGYTKAGEPDTASFYNRGLLLLRRPSELPGISYIANSPRLEHTFGRDNIVADDGYHQMMTRLIELGGDPLIEALSQKLDEGFRKDRPEAELAELQKRLASLLRNGVILPHGAQHRVVACSPHGDLFTLSACQAAARAQKLFIVAHPSPLSAAAGSNGLVVFEEWEEPLLSALYPGEPPRLESVLVLPLPLEDFDMQHRVRGDTLRTTTLALLSAVSAPVESVEIGYLDYPGSSAAALPAVVQLAPFKASALVEAYANKQPWDGPRRSWVLNADHPSVAAALELAFKEPELAAYNLIKLCLLGGVLTPELDSRLLTLAMEKRCYRQQADR